MRKLVCTPVTMYQNIKKELPTRESWYKQFNSNKSIWSSPSIDWDKICCTHQTNLHFLGFRLDSAPPGLRPDRCSVLKWEATTRLNRSTIWWHLYWSLHKVSNSFVTTTNKVNWMLSNSSLSALHTLALSLIVHKLIYFFLRGERHKRQTYYQFNLTSWFL